jgi:hypothetical protein
LRLGAGDTEIGQSTIVHLSETATAVDGLGGPGGGGPQVREESAQILPPPRRQSGGPVQADNVVGEHRTLLRRIDA